jgi:putative peptidoglycan lipid II flippase
VSKTARQPRTGKSAILVFIGIFVSKIAGVIRTSFINRYFGLSAEADAFWTATRIPNILQNLLGEGVLSASFIPVYASLLAKGDRKEADRVAGAIGALLLLLVAILVVGGVTVTPYIVPLIAPGFTGEKRELTIQLVRIIFPGTGLLVLGAWCLGVLNSHHKFLLSYGVGALWNAAQIVTLLMFGHGTALPKLSVYLAWGYVAGAALQFGAQLPVVMRLAPNLRMVLDVTSENVRTVTRNFLPVLVSRGVVQLSAYIDSIIATLLGTGAAAALASAQQIYMAPIGLFGMAVSAAELPAMSGAAVTSEDGFEAVRRRLNAGLRPIAFFVVPSAVGFLALGDLIAAAILQGGRFNQENSLYVWGILAGASVGLLAQTLGRLYINGYYALRDPRSPLNFAIIRIALTTILGYICAVHLPGWLGLPKVWGAVGLTGSAGAAGWVEMLLLRHRLNKRIGHTGLPVEYVVKLWGSALTAAAVGWAIKLSLPHVHPIVAAAAVLIPYSLVFGGMTLLLRVPEASAVFNKIVRR